MITFYACPGQLELWHESPDNGGHPMWQNGEPPRSCRDSVQWISALRGRRLLADPTKVPIGNLPNVVSTARASPSSDGPAGCLSAGATSNDDATNGRTNRET
jgi:hypothetical protein